MEQNEKQLKIYTAINNIMAELNPISKSKTNQQQGYKFRGIDDMYNAVHPLFAKHNVFITSNVIESKREERQSSKGGLLLWTIVRCQFTFTTSDGSSVTSTLEGEAMDSADKSTNKAMSAALKYCLMQMLLIPTEDLQDADQTTPEPMAKPQLKADDGKPWLTEKQFKDAKERIGSGERDLFDKLIIAFKMKKEYRAELEQLANTF